MSSRHLVRVARLAALALAGFAVATPAGAEVVKVGMVNSLTGPHSSFDLPTSEGVAMAFDEINKRGGITVKGKKYTFSVVSEDAQSKPEIAGSGAQRLLRDDDIKIVFGILTSGPGVPTATLLDTLLGKPGFELAFRTLDADAIVAKSFVPLGVKQLGVKKVGILLPNEDVSRSIVAVYKPLLEQAGISVPMVEYFQPDTSDFGPVLRKFQNQEMDGLLTGTNDAIVEAVVRQSTELGGLPKKFLYRGGSGAPGIKYAKQIDSFIWQILTRDLEHGDDPKVAEWIKRYKAFTSKDASPNTYWGLTFYDTVFMMAKAMEDVGSVTDVKAIAAKVKSMRYDGVRLMRYDNDGRANSDIDIGILKDGKISSVRASPE